MKREAKQSRKRQAKMATLIATKLGRNPAPIAADLPERDLFSDLVRLCRRSKRAEARGYRLANERLVRDQLALMKQLRNQVDRWLDARVRDDTPKFQCDRKQIVDELAAIETEFSGIEIDFRSQTVSAVTPEIELDGVCLGRFRICLEVRYLGESRPYRVIALDPECSRDCDETTHPHVQSEALCEGEGAEPIKHALREGRLSDFFTIVRQILQTYNPDSAYTQLSDWFGVECHDCGSTVDRDDCNSCDRCDAKTCEDCSTSCADCDRTVCGNCSESCESCGLRFCDACLSECRECGETNCDDCLNKGICDDCTESALEETEAEKASAQVAPV